MLIEISIWLYPLILLFSIGMVDSLFFKKLISQEHYKIFILMSFIPCLNAVNFIILCIIFLLLLIINILRGIIEFIKTDLSDMYEEKK